MIRLKLSDIVKCKLVLRILIFIDSLFYDMSSFFTAPLSVDMKAFTFLQPSDGLYEPEIQIRFKPPFYAPAALNTALTMVWASC